MAFSAYLEWEVPFYPDFTLVNSLVQAGGGVFIKPAKYPAKPKLYPYFDVQGGLKINIKRTYFLFTGGGFVIPGYQDIRLTGSGWFGGKLIKNRFRNSGDFRMGIQIIQTPKSTQPVKWGILMQVRIFFKNFWKKRST